MTRIAALALALTVASPTVADDMGAKVDAAIARGVAWLRTRQQSAGHFGVTRGTMTYDPGAQEAHDNQPGIAGLCVYTLLQCGAGSEDPAVRKAMDWLRASQPVLSYEYAVQLLAAEAYWQRRKIERAARIADLADRATWLKKTPLRKVIDRADALWIRGLTGRLVALRNRSRQGWRYAPGILAPGGKVDVSATQFALFGLKSARRCGASVSKTLFYKSARWLLSVQEKRGVAVQAAGPPVRGSFVPMAGDRARGWPYMAKGLPRELQASGSMTAAALVGLIIARSELEGSSLWSRSFRKEVDRAVHDGLAWLDHRWTWATNPGGFRGVYYYFYTLERVGILGSLARIGRHDWYREGAAVLLANLKPVGADQGFWDGKDEVPPSDLIDTCYALLFLKKATRPVGVEISRMTPDEK